MTDQDQDDCCDICGFAPETATITPDGRLICDGCEEAQIHEDPHAAAQYAMYERLLDRYDY